jgi:heat shock protein HslJ
MAMKRIRLFEILGLVALLSLTGLACVSNTVDANGEKLEGVTWIMKSYGEPGSLTAALADKDVTLTFDKEQGALGGNGGVNAYGGNYELDGDKVRITDLYQTLIASTNEALNIQEAAYMKILNSAQSYDIDDGELTITGTEGVLVFEKK